MVDVIIPTRNRSDLLADVIESIRQSTCATFSLWIVDQSDDGRTRQLVEEIRAQDSRVYYTRPEHVGSNYARNHGLRQGSAPFVVYTDDDCQVTPEWLQVMVDELQKEETWAVFGRIIPDPNYITHVPAEQRQIGAALPLALKDGAERRVYRTNRFDLSFGHGANMGFRRARLEEIGGFDNQLGSGGRFRSWPERDIGYRILKRGGEIVYAPAALIYHRYWRSWDKLSDTFKNYGIGAGAAAAKYMRCGDWGGVFLLGEWMVDQGVRQILSGIFKWHSIHKIRAGWFQIVYPLVGLMRSFACPVDRRDVLFVGD